MLAQEGHGGGEVLRHLFAITLALQGPAVVVITGVTAERGECVRRERDEAGNGKPSRHILYVRIESPILVDDDDAR